MSIFIIFKLVNRFREEEVEFLFVGFFFICFFYNKQSMEGRVIFFVVVYIKGEFSVIIFGFKFDICLGFQIIEVYDL